MGRKKIEHEDAIDRLTLAALKLKNANPKVGLRNYGPDTWFFMSDGYQTCIKRDSTMVVDEKTFNNSIVPISSYYKGFIVRDDSVLSDDEIAAKPVKRPHNAIFDHEIDELIKDDDKAMAYITNVDSELTLKRIMAKCKGKPKTANVFSACEGQMFLVKNELPLNFYDINRKEMVALINEHNYPIRVEQDDTVEEIREKLVNYLQEG